MQRCIRGGRDIVAVVQDIVDNDIAMVATSVVVVGSGGGGVGVVIGIVVGVRFVVLVNAAIAEMTITIG